MQTAPNVIHLTPNRKAEHYWRKHLYLGPSQAARCSCGRTKRHWRVNRAPMERDGFRVTAFRCPCGRPIHKIDAVEGERACRPLP